MTVVRYSGSTAWISSDDMSMNRLTPPSTHTVRGMRVMRRDGGEEEKS
jgi:hypothetical protein